MSTLTTTAAISPSQTPANKFIISIYGPQNWLGGMLDLLHIPRLTKEELLNLSELTVNAVLFGEDYAFAAGDPLAEYLFKHQIRTDLINHLTRTWFNYVDAAVMEHIGGVSNQVTYHVTWLGYDQVLFEVIPLSGPGLEAAFDTHFRYLLALESDRCTE